MSDRLWLVNRVLNGLALLAGVGLLAAVAFVWLRAVLAPESDPHGYTLIFGVLVGLLLVVPLLLLVTAAIELRRGRRGGLIWQAAAGLVVGMYAAVLGDVARWLGLGIGAPLAVVALAAYVLGRRAGRNGGNGGNAGNGT